jgi:hypothetical protein
MMTDDTLDYLVIPYKPGLAYMQRVRLMSASDSPLTTEEQVIIYLFNECERLRNRKCPHDLAKQFSKQTTGDNC